MSYYINPPRDLNPLEAGSFLEFIMPEPLQAAVVPVGAGYWAFFPSDLLGWAVVFSTITMGLYYGRKWLNERDKDSD